MKIYKVKVNGKVYEVELESVSEKNAPVVEKVENKVESKPLVEGVTLKAPMQGTILDVKVNVGDQVNKGQCVFILEAMKLENEIVSPATGVVKQILVTKGTAVENQEVLAIIG